MRVLLLSRYGALGASSRIRSYQYLPHLEAAGIHVDVSPLFDDVYLRNRYAGGKPNPLKIAVAYARRIRALAGRQAYDLAWVESEILPWLPARLGSFLCGGRNGMPYIVDYDDPMFHRYDEHGNPVVRKLLGRKIDEVMARSRTVIAGNDYLAGHARRAGAGHVKILPSVIDLDHYRWNAESDDRPTGPFTIGWMGSPSTAKYLELIEPALHEIGARGGYLLSLVGSGYMRLDGIPTQVHQWTEADEASRISSFDAGIMPLSNDNWSRGKCGYKLIQYMACGRAVIASPVGVNTDIVEDGVNGFLASTHDDWVEAIDRLRSDGTLREKMGLTGRRKIESEYCVQRTAPDLVEIMRDAVA